MADDREIERLMRGMSQMDGDEALPPPNPAKLAGMLRENLAKYDRGLAFERGQILRQTVGLCINQHATAVLPFQFVEYLPEPKLSFFPYHHFDCVLAVLDGENDTQFYLGDSRRFEPYPEDELERLGAEAAKAIN